MILRSERGGRRWTRVRRGVVVAAAAMRRFDERHRLEPAPIDLQIEDVEPIVVADDVVHLLRLDAASEIDLGVDDAFFVDQGLADHAPVRTDDAREGAGLALQASPRVRYDAFHRRDDFLGDGRAGDDREELAFEGMGDGAQLDGLGHVVVGWRHRQRDVARHVNELALGQKSEAGEGVGVSPQASAPSGPIAVSCTRSPAPSPGAQVSFSAQVGISCDACPAGSIGTDRQQSVIERADRARAALVDADHDVDAGVTCRAAQDVDLRAGLGDGRADQLVEPGPARHRIGDPAPIRVTRDEDLGKGNEIRAVRPRLADQAHGLLDGRRRSRNTGAACTAAATNLGSFSIQLSSGVASTTGDAASLSLRRTPRPHRPATSIPAGHAPRRRLRRPAGDDVPGLEGDRRRNVGDQVVDLEKHVAGVGALLLDTVHRQPEVEPLGVGNVVGGDDAWPEGRVRVLSLGEDPLSGTSVVARETSIITE